MPGRAWSHRIDERGCWSPLSATPADQPGRLTLDDDQPVVGQPAGDHPLHQLVDRVPGRVVGRIIQTTSNGVASPQGTAPPRTPPPGLQVDVLCVAAGDGGGAPVTLHAHHRTRTPGRRLARDRSRPAEQVEEREPVQHRLRGLARGARPVGDQAERGLPHPVGGRTRAAVRRHGQLLPTPDSGHDPAHATKLPRAQLRSIHSPPLSCSVAVIASAKPGVVHSGSSATARSAISRER